MSLTIGAQLGSYEITALLGKGGMGEVYRARDTKLKRDVAIKILPDEFSRDTDRVGRFQREAEVLASLNHPNIAAIYDLQEANGTRFLVLELVEGETLAERLRRGRIAVEEALTIALEIAEAFEAAHEKGIIHRDLKPANVKVTPEGKVKVLDFGLAKALEAPPRQTASNSPTILSAATNGGMILGTAGYMSPEQARGHVADERSDIFSFGCVLYEMLTGRKTFQGDTVTDLIASVVAREPDFAAFPESLNPRLTDLVRRCLAKNRKERWHAIADVRVEIQSIVADPYGVKLRAATGVAVRHPLWKRALPFAVSAPLIVITALVVWSLRPAQPSPAIARFPLVLPPGQAWTNTSGHLLAISPNGTDIVYVANRQLFLRTLADMEARPIQGTAGDVDTPFFSPDGQWLGFYVRGERRLKKIPITGGTPFTICEAERILGASWDSNDQIYFGQRQGVVRVNASGGKAEQIVTLKPQEIAQGPQILPGGDALLFTVSVSLNPIAWDRASIVVHSLKTGKRTVLIEGGSDARYVPTGHIVYAVGSRLLARAFDVKNLRIMSPPVAVINDVLRPRSVAGVTGAAYFSFSNNGSMIYVPGDELALPGLGAEVTLALVDRAGNRKALNLAPAPYNQPRISPNGKQLAYHTEYGEDRVIYIYDLTGAAAPRKLTFGGHNHRATWSPNGERLVFTSDREGDNALFWQRADGNGPVEQLSRGEPGVTVQSEAWSDHGNVIIFSSSRGGLRTLSMLSPGRDQKPKALITTYSTNASLSPDGHWLAYTSDEDAGINQVYVQPFPPTGPKFQVSTETGRSPLWDPSGKQLFYLKGQLGTETSQIISVDIQTQPTFEVLKTTALPIEGIKGETGPRAYDITPNGKSFIVMIPNTREEPSNALPQQIHITLNWFEELKQRVPVH